jgi:hypothetical protein
MKKLYKNSLKTSVKSGKYKLLRERRYHMFCICLPTEHGNPEVSEGRKKEEKGGLGKEESRSRRGRDVTDHAHSRQEEDEDDDVACLLACSCFLSQQEKSGERKKKMARYLLCCAFSCCQFEKQFDTFCWVHSVLCAFFSAANHARGA